MTMGYNELVNRWIKVEPSENAERILKQRYYWRDREDNYLEMKWEDVCRRVARVVAAGELKNPALEDKDEKERLDFIKRWESTFFEMLKGRIFIPNSPTLFNAGLGVEKSLLWKPVEEMSLRDYEMVFKARNHLHMLSACFVVPVEDSIDGIFEAVKEYALITKAGGGVGSNFSELRPKGSTVAGTSGRASGPVSFMHVFNTAINVVEQGYKRRGALMGILDITHPDIEEFIIAKRDNDGNAVLRYFNISVGIWNKEKVLELFHSDGELELTHPRSEIKRRVRVRDLFYKIAESAWKSGDPGLAFLGEMNKYYALYPNKKIVSTNPCGEIGLSDYEACNLGSIDVAKFVREDGDLDWEALAETVKYAVRFLDNVIEVNVFPLEKIDKSVRGSRRLGLGIMGFADTLYMLDIPYNTPEARQFAADLMGFIALNACESSSILAEEKGNFPLFHLSRWNDPDFKPFAMGLSRYDDDLRELFRHTLGKKRNVALLTIAPTGSISNIADTSSGLEPNFLLAYTRYMNRSDGTREPLVYVNRILMKRLGNLLDDDLKQRIIEEGSLKNIHEIPEEIRKVFVVSHDISPMDHLLMQDAFQRYVDNNISKTINMPNAATVEDVLDIYLEAMKLNVRGLTIYRDGSLETQVLTSMKKLKTKDAPKVQFFVLDEKHKLRARPRKESLRSVTRKFKREDGTTYITVSFDDNGEAIEIFVSNGSEASEVIGRLSSIALRAGVSLEEILEQLRKVRGDYARGIAEEIKKAVDDFIELWGPQEEAETELIHIDGTRKTEEEIEKFVRANDLKWVNGYYVDAEGNAYCPVCLSKNSLVNQEGCMSCMNCGWSKCTVG